MITPVKRDVFFATSFSGHVDYDTGFVHNEFREEIKGLLDALRIGGFTVYCAVEAEGWRIGKEAPGVSMAKNFENIEKRPIFLAKVDRVGSDGRGIEIEHAHNSGSQVFLTTGPGESLGWVMEELVALGRAEYIPHESPSQLVTTLNRSISI